MNDAGAGEGRSRPGPIRALFRVRRSWRRLSPFFQASRTRIALLVALAVVTGLVEAGLLAAIAAMAAALAVGDQTITQQFGSLSLETSRTAAFAIAVAMALLRAGLQVGLAYVPAQMSSKVLADLRNQLFQSFTASTWSVKASERDGAFQMLMTRNVTNAAQAVINLALAVTATIMFLTMVVAAFLQSFVAAAALMASAFILFVALRPLSRKLRRHAKQLSTEEMEFTNTVQEVVLIAEETEVFGATETYRSGFRDQVEEVRRPHARTRFLAVVVPALYHSVALLLLVIALIAISISGMAHLAALAAVILMLIRALTYAQQIQFSLTGIDERLPFMNQIVDALERYRLSPQQDGPDSLDGIQSLALSHVTFAYRAGQEVLHDVSFELGRGEAIGVVGPSGAGKSSIVQLLLRLRDPDSGAVRVNGRDVREISRSQWQAKVAYVPQTSQVVWGTVRENIRFYREWIDDDQVVAAARRAHIHDDVMSWPSGYDTIIGQRASAVSGGQRQRICLARALAGDPEVLVLDEPTSALDVRSEELVQESLRLIKQHTMIILIAHRLSTLSVCDRIVVMVDGRVSAIGSREDLMQRSDFFREVNQITGRHGAGE
ncbi:ABC transporter ATP-binding protein/permease [Ruania suaedae]|uniref:ABC transporter ATP-binding protein n=1 Tax=Ruania suaedae TaxID=2897774 RepID=UPI001E52F592|nr:ABC transporter ATP-binding protein [Ruania suaedae]UFU02394.1 ABC transporter ATP-binding protein/permease [Ruania suaedae]